WPGNQDFAVAADIEDVRNRRAAERRYERAAPHSITSSARASSVGGVSSRRALATIRVITRSNFTGWFAGISPAFVHRKILLSRCMLLNESGRTSSPPAGARANASIAMSISAGLRTPDAIASTPSEGAAVAIDCRYNSDDRDSARPRRAPPRAPAP